MNFKEYIKLCELAQDGPLGTVIPSSPFGAIPSDEGKPNSGDPAPVRPTRGDFDLGLPSVTVTSPIAWISGPGMQQPGQQGQENSANSRIVHITLENGLSVFMSYDELKRLSGEPKRGQMATVVLQRRPDDTSRMPSQIQSFRLH